MERSGGQYDEVYCSITLHVYRNISQQLFYYIINVCYAFPAILEYQIIDVTDGSCDVLASLPVSHTL